MSDDDTEENQSNLTTFPVEPSVTSQHYSCFTRHLKLISDSVQSTMTTDDLTRRSDEKLHDLRLIHITLQIRPRPVYIYGSCVSAFKDCCDWSQIQIRV